MHVAPGIVTGIGTGGTYTRKTQPETDQLEGSEPTDGRPDRRQDRDQTQEPTESPRKAGHTGKKHLE